jgi:hypothetical protein
MFMRYATTAAHDTAFVCNLYISGHPMVSSLHPAFALHPLYRTPGDDCGAIAVHHAAPARVVT